MREMFDGFDSIGNARNFHYDMRIKRRQLLAFANHPFIIGRYHLSTHITVDDITYLDVTNNDSTDITVSYTDAGNKTHYVVLNVSSGLDSNAKDYETKKTTIQNGMKVIVSQVTTEALKYSYNEVTANKTAIEKNLLTYLQDQFQTDVIQSVTLTKILAS